MIFSNISSAYQSKPVKNKSQINSNLVVQKQREFHEVPFSSYKPTLPLLTRTSQPDLWSISADVAAQLLKGEIGHNFDRILFFDCRYQDEFEGGHIQGSYHLPAAELVEQEIFQEGLIKQNVW